MQLLILTKIKVSYGCDGVCVTPLLYNNVYNQLGYEVFVKTN